MTRNNHFSTRTLVLLVLISGILASCSRDPKSTGRYFMPDMRYSQATETYTASPYFEDGLSARKPITGTIARGALGTDLPDSSQDAYHLSYLPRTYFADNFLGYEEAGEKLKNPLAINESNLKEGERLYIIYCEVCHGNDGAGKGTIVESGAFPPVPAYNDRLPTLNDGKMFHAITFGKNLMGSYSSQIDVEERWKVIYYIQQLAKVGPFAEEAASVEEEVVEAVN